jgi:iron complex transport system permease protein
MSVAEAGISRGADLTATPAEPNDEMRPPANAHLTRTRLTVTLALMAAGCAIIAIGATAFGSVHISLLRAVHDAASSDRAILMSVRLPRVLIGAAVGAILAAVGASLQAMVRNPLAEGGILGISGGAAMGAIVAMVAAARLGGGEAAVPVGAFIAALLSTFAVYHISLVRGRLEPFTLLLAGVIFNAFWGAAIMLVNSVVNFFFVRTIIFWLMGSFEAPTWREVIICASAALAGGGVLTAYARDLNLLSLGDDEAAILGVEVERLRRTVFVVTSLMIGVAVAVSGIITFVGLIVPHVLRMTLGADHRLLIPASLIGGAAFTVAADLFARTMIAPAELPVGAITALCGGPFFIFVLRREGRRTLGF